MGLGLHIHDNVDINNFHNHNPDPPISIYPQKSPNDALYQLPESALRSALFIPLTFQHNQGNKVPVLLVPGTGSYGGEAFAPNFAKLLKQSTFGDPVWLNIPGRMCDDAVKNAEYVAYAINYISTSCNKKIAVVAWSQRNLSVQWSLKYWPSTPQHVSNFICLSADFRGTVNAWLAAPADGVPCAPTVRPQRRGSSFLKTLLSNEGDSAYVPTTSIYSRTDEVVQPQFGKWASAIMGDERGVGVLNCEAQKVAGKKPAGLLYTHFTLLYNPLAWALTEDAIINGGPGRIDRIDMKCCMHTKSHGLTLLDLAKTNKLTAKCAKAIVVFSPNPKYEPELPTYCAKEERNYVFSDEAEIEEASKDEGVLIDFGGEGVNVVLWNWNGQGASESER